MKQKHFFEPKDGNIVLLYPINSLPNILVNTYYKLVDDKLFSSDKILRDNRKQKLKEIFNNEL